MEGRTQENRLNTRSLICAALLSCAVLPVRAQSNDDALARGFVNPPAAAKPRVWWHWMNGNVTRAGIEQDLEWMQRVGIGGVHNFDAALGTPPLVGQRLVYMTPPWRDAMRHAAQMTDRMGMELGIAGSPGFSESGGPWVRPEQAMKKLVWSETTIEGGRKFTGHLPPPPMSTGPMQDLPLPEYSFRPDPAPLPFYVDSAVVAYRQSRAESELDRLRPQVTSNAGKLDAALLSDGALAASTNLPKAPVGERAWVQLEYPRPVTVKALTLAVRRPYHPFANFMPVPESGRTLEASDDGKTFRRIADIPGGRIDRRTLAFPDVTARFFRVTFTTLPPGFDPLRGRDLDGTPLPKPDAHEILELTLHAGARVGYFEEKAAFAASTLTLADLPTPDAGDGAAIGRSAVLDLTTKLRADGTLDWTPPPGRWTVLRMGYSLTGHKNGPASAEATGLEVDKLDAGAVRAYFTTYLDQYRETLGPLMGARGLQYIVTDSWEAGQQNWTGNLIAEFTRRRGYSPLPFLPVLTGRVVESARASDAFLWDFRRTLADLVAEYHYETLSSILRERQLARYTESHENRRAFVADGMEVKRTAQIPMSAIWAQLPGDSREDFARYADVRESASVAHLYGQDLVAAESFTTNIAPFGWSPEMLKPTADRALALGLNRFVIHTSVHQPLSEHAPGLSLGPFGQWFTRNETWAEQASPWISYLARSSWLMQQGRAVADILYFYGEDSNITALFGERAPPIPPGFDFDYVNADALCNLLSVREGRLVAPSGAQYRVLALDPNSRHMSLTVLRRIRDLVAAGVSVVGGRPLASPSLGDDAAEFAQITADLWDGNKIADSSVTGAALEKRLADLPLEPDFAYSRPRDDTRLLFAHRQLPDGELYFVSSRNAIPQRVEASFRVAGKVAEVWHADTGSMERASFRIAQGRTIVPLDLPAYGAVFVVFRDAASVESFEAPRINDEVVARVAGPWDIRFQKGRGAPERIREAGLGSWTANADPGVKFFSGTATYETTIKLPARTFAAGSRLSLDLGAVANLAEVSVNGKPLGILWKSPFTVDATAALKPGVNRIEIGVTNLWVNRLIGDQQPGVTKPIAFTVGKPYAADAPLLPSGLLGPVHIVRRSVVPAASH